MYLGSGGDATITNIGFLKGTSTANMSGSAGERAGGYFDARQGQTVTLQVLDAGRGSLAGAARSMRNSTLQLQVKLSVRTLITVLIVSSPPTSSPAGS